MKLICVHKVAPARFISIWDAKSGFWQLMVRPEDRWKCAFVTHLGVWSWKRMSFGLRNAPATFVKAIRKVLYLIREHSDAYVDDMYTISHSFVDHLKHLRAFLLYTDASLYAVGCCLAQKDESGDKHPIAYGSHKLTPTQCNWSTIEREAFAVLWALNRFHDIIFGAHTTVLCDHDPLKYLLQNTTQSAKVTRLALAIQQYDIVITHIKGSKNVVADGLSRVIT